MPDLACAQAALAWAILSDWGWRWLVVLSSLPLLALMLLYPCLPESPYWLLATGQTAAAEALLQRIADANGKSLPRGRLRPGAAAAAGKVRRLPPCTHANLYIVACSFLRGLTCCSSLRAHAGMSLLGREYEPTGSEM
jgi:hypothetical protein